MKIDRKKAIIAMSGGVDSSVAAYLMQQKGCECIGVTMKLTCNEDLGVSKGHTCCSLEDVEDARSVAQALGMPYYVMNFSDEFRETVMDHFVSSYEAGRTPNPCIECNRHLKFGKLFQRMKELAYDLVVTGHYARVEWSAERGRWLLKKAVDASKDQSYVLYAMTQEQLAHCDFPLGGMTKEEARELAEQLSFVNAHKHDSQDICFVPDGDYVAFMERHTGRKYPAGNFVDLQGRVLGQHRGAVRYTLGQRKGLGLAMGEPVFVCDKDMEANTVTVAPESALFCDTLLADDVNWISFAEPPSSLRVNAKIRYRQTEEPATVYALPDGKIRLVFDRPQRAISPGQAVVMYQGDEVLGGGTILAAERPEDEADKFNADKLD